MNWPFRKQPPREPIPPQPEGTMFYNCTFAMPDGTKVSTGKQWRTLEDVAKMIGPPHFIQLGGR